MNSLAAEFKKMRLEGTMTDVVIKCGDLIYPAHKLVLAGASGYFKAMFTSDMKENQATEIDIGVIVDPNIMISVLDYMYTETIDVNHDTQSLLRAAEYFQMNTLSDMCCQHLLKFQSLSDAFETWCIFQEFGKEAKHEIVLQLCKRLDEIYLKEDFLKLDCFRMRELIQLSGHMEIPNKFSASKWSDMRFQALVNWVKYKLDDRKQLFESSLELIDLRDVSGSCLVHVLERETWIMRVPSITGKLTNATLSNLWPRKQVTTLVYLPNKHSIRIYCVHFDVPSYKVLTEQEVPLQYFESSEVVYVCSTECVVIFFTSKYEVFSYNLETQLWNEILIDSSPFTSTKTCIISCIFFQNDLYVLGEDTFVRYYDLHISIRMEERNHPVISHTFQRESLVEIGNKLYCIGGKELLQEFDISNNKWHQVDFKSQSLVNILQDKTFLFSCEGSELSILTDDFLNLFVLSLPNKDLLSVNVINLTNSIKPTRWLAFKVFTHPIKSNHVMLFILNTEGYFCTPVTDGNIETWIEGIEVLHIEKGGSLNPYVNFFCVNLSSCLSNIYLRSL